MAVLPEQIAEQLVRILGGSPFLNASRSRALLEYVVQEALAGRADSIKEYTIGVAALARSPQFDPRTDPIVRAEASRLRTKLETYYAGEGKADPVEIKLPRGTYVPQFSMRKDSAVEEAEPGITPTAAPHGHSRQLRILIPLLLLVPLLFAAFVAGSRLVPRRNGQLQTAPVFLDVELRAPGPVASQAGPDFSISPDGKKIVFIAISNDGTPRLYLKRLDRFPNTVLEGTEGVRAPFFSPDGNSVGFWASSKLKKTSLDGGAPVILCDATDLLGGSWGDDGFIVAAIERQKLSRIPATGGRPEVILDLSKEGRTPAWPQVLPGSKQIVFTSLGFDGADRASIDILQSQTGVRSTIITGATYGRILSDSWLIYTNQSTILALPLRSGLFKAAGDPITTTLRVPYSSTFGYAQYDVSPTGTLIYRRTSGLTEPHWVTEGADLDLPLLAPGRYVYPAVSPDGSRLAITETVSGFPGVLIREIAGQRVTHLPSPSQVPVWSPDGNFLVLGAMPYLAWSRMDGTGGVQRLTSSSTLQSAWSFSPDGKTLAYAEFDKNRGFDLWTLPVLRTAEGIEAGKPSPFLQTPAFETYPSFSPDGRWIAYASNETGTWEVYIRAFPDNGTKVQVSSGGGRISRWSRKKQELIFRNDDHRLMVATYSVNGGKVTISSVRPFQAPRLADTGVLANFDVGPDGRVLGLFPASSQDGEQSANHVSIVFNFPVELDRLRTRRQSP